MKKINELFVRISSISHMSDDESKNATIRRVEGFFEISVTDEVTDAVLRRLFIGELVDKSDKRWALIEKRGTKLRCVSRKDTLAEALVALNSELGTEFFDFSMETLAELS